MDQDSSFHQHGNPLQDQFHTGAHGLLAKVKSASSLQQFDDSRGVSDQQYHQDVSQPALEATSEPIEAAEDQSSTAAVQDSSKPHQSIPSTQLGSSTSTTQVSSSQQLLSDDGALRQPKATLSIEAPCFIPQQPAQTHAAASNSSSDTSNSSSSSRNSSSSFQEADTTASISAGQLRVHALPFQPSARLRQKQPQQQSPPGQGLTTQDKKLTSNLDRVDGSKQLQKQKQKQQQKMSSKLSVKAAAFTPTPVQLQHAATVPVIVSQSMSDTQPTKVHSKRPLMIKPPTGSSTPASATLAAVSSSRLKPAASAPAGTSVAAPGWQQGGPPLPATGSAAAAAAAAAGPSRVASPAAKAAAVIRRPLEIRPPAPKGSKIAAAPAASQAAASKPSTSGASTHGQAAPAAAPFAAAAAHAATSSTAAPAAAAPPPPSAKPWLPSVARSKPSSSKNQPPPPPAPSATPLLAPAAAAAAGKGITAAPQTTAVQGFPIVCTAVNRPLVIIDLCGKPVKLPQLTPTAAAAVAASKPIPPATVAPVRRPLKIKSPGCSTHTAAAPGVAAAAAPVAAAHPAAARPAAELSTAATPSAVTDAVSSSDSATKPLYFISRSLKTPVAMKVQPASGIAGAATPAFTAHKADQLPGTTDRRSVEALKATPTAASWLPDAMSGSTGVPTSASGREQSVATAIQGAAGAADAGTVAASGADVTQMVGPDASSSADQGEPPLQAREVPDAAVVISPAAPGVTAGGTAAEQQAVAVLADAEAAEESVDDTLKRATAALVEAHAALAAAAAIGSDDVVDDAALESLLNDAVNSLTCTQQAIAAADNVVAATDALLTGTTAQAMVKEAVVHSTEPEARPIQQAAEQATSPMDDATTPPSTAVVRRLSASPAAAAAAEGASPGVDSASDDLDAVGVQEAPVAASPVAVAVVTDALPSATDVSVEAQQAAAVVAPEAAVASGADAWITAAAEASAAAGVLGVPADNSAAAVVAALATAVPAPEATLATPAETSDPAEGLAAVSQLVQPADTDDNGDVDEAADASGVRAAAADAVPAEDASTATAAASAAAVPAVSATALAAAGAPLAARNGMYTSEGLAATAQLVQPAEAVDVQEGGAAADVSCAPAAAADAVTGDASAATAAAAAPASGSNSSGESDMPATAATASAATIPFVIPVALPVAIPVPTDPASVAVANTTTASSTSSTRQLLKPLYSQQSTPAPSKRKGTAAAAAAAAEGSGASAVVSPGSNEWHTALTQLLSREGFSGKSADVKWRVILPTGDRLGPFTPDQTISWLVQGSTPKGVSRQQAAAAAADPAAVQLCGILSSDHNAQRLPGAKFFRPLSELLPAVAAGLRYDAVTKADIAKGVPAADWNRVEGSSGGSDCSSTSGSSAVGSIPPPSNSKGGGGWKQMQQQGQVTSRAPAAQSASGFVLAVGPQGADAQTQEFTHTAAAAGAATWEVYTWEPTLPPLAAAAEGKTAGAGGSNNSSSGDDDPNVNNWVTDVPAGSQKSPAAAQAAMAGAAISSSSSGDDRKLVFYGPPVCYHCGDRGHAGTGCSTPFCMSCDVWGHAKGQCADACERCGRVHERRDGVCRTFYCQICGLFGHRPTQCPGCLCGACGFYGHNSNCCPTSRACPLCGELGHPQSSCPLLCSRCGYPGHKTEDCMMKQCERCSVPGHTAADCLFGTSRAGDYGSVGMHGRRGSVRGSELATAADVAAAANDMPPGFEDNENNGMPPGFESPRAGSGSRTAAVMKPSAAGPAQPDSVRLLKSPKTQADKGHQHVHFVEQLLQVPSVEDYAMNLLGDEQKLNYLSRLPPHDLSVILQQNNPGQALDRIYAYHVGMKQEGQPPGASHQQASAPPTQQQQEQIPQQGPQQQQQEQTAVDERTIQPCRLLPVHTRELEQSLPHGLLPPNWTSYTSWAALDKALGWANHPVPPSELKRRFRAGKAQAQAATAAAMDQQQQGQQVGAWEDAVGASSMSSSRVSDQQQQQQQSRPWAPKSWDDHLQVSAATAAADSWDNYQQAAAAPTAAVSWNTPHQVSAATTTSGSWNAPQQATADNTGAGSWNNPQRMFAATTAADSTIAPGSNEWHTALTQLLSREGFSGKSADVKWRVILPTGDRLGPFTPDQAISWLVQGSTPKGVSRQQAAAAAADPAAVQLCGILSSDHNAQRLPGAKFFRPLSELLPAVAAGLRYNAVTKADIANGVPAADWNRVEGSSDGSEAVMPVMQQHQRQQEQQQRQEQGQQGQTRHRLARMTSPDQVSHGQPAEAARSSRQGISGRSRKSPSGFSRPEPSQQPADVSAGGKLPVNPSDISPKDLHPQQVYEMERALGSVLPAGWQNMSKWSEVTANLRRGADFRVQLQSYNSLRQTLQLEVARAVSAELQQAEEAQLEAALEMSQQDVLARQRMQQWGLQDDQYQQQQDLEELEGYERAAVAAAEAGPVQGLGAWGSGPPVVLASPWAATSARAAAAATPAFADAALINVWPAASTASGDTGAAEDPAAAGSLESAQDSARRAPSGACARVVAAAEATLTTADSHVSLDPSAAGKGALVPVGIGSAAAATAMTSSPWSNGVQEVLLDPAAVHGVVPAPAAVPGPAVESASRVMVPPPDGSSAGTTVLGLQPTADAEATVLPPTAWTPDTAVHRATQHPAGSSLAGLAHLSAVAAMPPTHLAAQFGPPAASTAGFMPAGRHPATLAGLPLGSAEGLHASPPILQQAYQQHMLPQEMLQHVIHQMMAPSEGSPQQNHQQVQGVPADWAVADFPGGVRPVEPQDDELEELLGLLGVH